MQVLWLAVAFFSAGVLATEEEDGKRPFWNIAHMINDIKHFDEIFRDGANAVEADVWYESSGKPTKFFHGVPCDAQRWCRDSSEITPYINEVRERTTHGNNKYNANFALMEFDHKLKRVAKGNFETAGKHFAKHMLNLYSGSSKVKVLMSLPKISQKEFVSGFLEVIRNKEPDLINKFGYEFSEEKGKDPKIIKDAFKSVGVEDKFIWLSNGITNFSPAEIDFEPLLKYRDDTEVRFASKVYGWTADKETTLRKWVAKGLDAIITNKPKNLSNVLKGFWTSHRLATQDDNPFEWIPTTFSPKPFYQAYACSHHPSRAYNYCWKSCPGDTRYCWTDTYCGKGEDVCYKELSCKNQEEEKKCQA